MNRRSGRRDRRLKGEAEFCYLPRVSSRYDVFISYHRADGGDRMRLLKQKIEGERLSVWMDEEINPRSAFRRQIEDALDNSACVVAVWTKGAAATDWVWGEADRGKDRLISVRFDDGVRVPLPFNAYDVVDLTDWPSDSGELKRLLDGIYARLGRTPSTPSSRAAKGETFTRRVAKSAAEAIRKFKEEEPILPREEQLRDLLPDAICERLTHTNALIDQLSRDSLSQAGSLARDLVGEIGKGSVDERKSLDDWQIALLRSHYLLVLLGGHPASYEVSEEGGLAAALSSGDPQQIDSALTERIGEPDDQSLLLFALYVLFPIGKVELGQKFLKAAASVNPQSAEIKFHLARARELLSKRSSCLRLLRDTLRMSPNAELAVIYQTPTLLRSGKNAAARANLEMHGDSLAEPIRAILEDLVVEQSIDRAMLLQGQLDAALNTLRLPVRPIADVFASPAMRGIESRPLPKSWLGDVAERAEGYLQSVSSRTLGRH